MSCLTQLHSYFQKTADAFFINKKRTSKKKLYINDCGQDTSTTHFEYVDLCLISEKRLRNSSEVAAAATLRATLPRTLLSGGKILSKEICKKVRPSNKEKKELKIEKERKQVRK